MRNEPMSAISSRSTPAKPVVLIIDDNMMLTNLLARLIGPQMNATVLQAHSCREALRHAEQSAPNVIVADLNLPDGDGLDAAEQIQSQTPHVTLVLMSAAASEDQLERAKERFPYVATLHKPFDSCDLLDALRSALCAVASEAWLGEAAPASRPVLDISQEIEAVGSDIRALLLRIRENAHSEKKIHEIVEGPLEELVERIFRASTALRSRNTR